MDNLHEVLAALQPASTEDSEAYGLGENALIGRLPGQTWAFYYEDNGCGSKYPTLACVWPSGRPTIRFEEEA